MPDAAKGNKHTKSMVKSLSTYLETEQKLLCLLIAHSPDASPFLTDILGSSEELDWARFRGLVHRHRVGGLVRAGLEQFSAICPPSEVVAWLDDQISANAVSYLRWVKVTRDLTAAFAEQDIACVSLKGAGIAARYYREPSQREMIDVDLLVPPESYEAAERIVASQGFDRFFPSFDISGQRKAAFMALHNAFAYVRRSDGAQIDLHWRMVQNPAMMPLLDNAWAGMVENLDIAGQRLPMLEPATHFVYVCVHGIKSGWARLKWLADVDRMTRGLSDHEAEEAAAQFRTHGLETVAGASFALSHRILGTPIPDVFAQFDGRKVEKLIALELPMIFDELPAKPHQLSDWRHFVDRFRHSVMMHKGGGYRRHALLSELARPRDIETVAVSPATLWLLPIISPILGVIRTFKRAFASQK